MGGPAADIEVKIASADGELAWSMVREHTTPEHSRKNTGCASLLV